MPEKTTLGKVMAKWMPDTWLSEFPAVMELHRRKAAAMDLSPPGIQAMLTQAETLLQGEDNLSRRATITAARKCLQQLASGAPEPDDWFPIWDVFCYWPAAEEIIAARPAPTPEEEAWSRMTPLERLSLIVNRPKDAARAKPSSKPQMCGFRGRTYSRPSGKSEGDE